MPGGYGRPGRLPGRLMHLENRSNQNQLESLAEEIFELTNMSSRARARAHTDDSVESLTESELLTLDLVCKQDVMTVGEIQRTVGVLPAQMSRIVRSLEDKSGKAFVRCAINPQDRRKIDVSITPAGRKARDAYRSARLGMTVGILEALGPKERDDFMRTLRKIRRHFDNLLTNK